MLVRVFPPLFLGSKSCFFPVGQQFSPRGRFAPQGIFVHAETLQLSKLGVFLASGGQKPEILLTSSSAEDSTPQQRFIWPMILIVLRLRNFDKGCSTITKLKKVGQGKGKKQQPQVLVISRGWLCQRVQVFFSEPPLVIFSSKKW